ncbi:MAG: XdhC family protein [Alphaproteobacteria bacterium]
MKKQWLDKIQACRLQGEAVALVTDLSTGQASLIYSQATEGESGLASSILEAVRKRLRNDQSGLEESENGTEFFVQIFSSPLRLILIGAVHIAQALAPLARMTGYKVYIVDPRRAFNTDARFPGIETSHDWPDEGVALLKPDRRTAIVTLTHDPKLDDPALQQALKSEAFYIGALGSRKTHAVRLERLISQGASHETIQRIHGPVGLKIGAITPAEIAIAILAEITATLRGIVP